MPSSTPVYFHDSNGSADPAPRRSRDWDHRAIVTHPISAPPAALPGKGLVRARARIPAASRPATHSTASGSEAAARSLHKSRSSLGSLNLLTPSDSALPPPATRPATASGRSPRSISPREIRDWDRRTQVIVSPPSPLPEVPPQREAVTFVLWRIIANNQDFLTPQNFYTGMQKVFPSEMHLAFQELWVTMARSLGGSVSQLQFQVFFERSRPDFLFGQDKRHKLLQRYMRHTSAPGLHSPASHEREDWHSGKGSPHRATSVSPRRLGQTLEQEQEPATPVATPRSEPVEVFAGGDPVTPADASARAREHILRSAAWTGLSQVPDEMGFKPVVLHSPRARYEAAPSQSKPQKDKVSSPKEMKAARDTARLQQYLSWMRSVLPEGERQSIGIDGSGLCNGLLLFKLMKAIGAPADRLQSLHLQMDQGVRTRRLWLRNMEAIGNCVLACSSSIGGLEPELAVDGDPGALVALLRLMVQTFVVKKISKTRLIEWCAAHLQFFNVALQPQTIQFPHSNASLQKDFSDGLLISLLLQRCIPAADEAVGSDALLLLQESELHCSSYSNRHIAIALAITLGVQPYFNLQQLELKPVEHNFLWMQLNAIYLAFGSALPAPATRAAVIESKPAHAPDDRDAKGSSTKEREVLRKLALQEKRTVEVKSAELHKSIQRLDDVKRTLRVLTSPRSQNPSGMLQQARQTQAQLQEQSEALQDTSSDIYTVKQALAAVVQQQQEVQALVLEHDALKAAQERDISFDGYSSAQTIQPFLEKLQRATLLEASYKQRASILRAAAQELLPKLDCAASSIPENYEFEESIDKAQTDLLQMEQFFKQQRGSHSSASVNLLTEAKRSQLQQLLLLRGQSSVLPEELQHIQTLLSSELSLQQALDHEAHVAEELQQLLQQIRHEENTGDKRLQHQRPVSASTSPSSKEAKSRRSGLRVQFPDSQAREEDTDAELQYKVYSAELLAIERLINSKQSQGDDKAVCALSLILQRKQTRILSLLPPKQSLPSQGEYRHKLERPVADCFSLSIINGGEGSCCWTDAAAWRLFWQSLDVQFTEEFVFGGSNSSGAPADGHVGFKAATVASSMRQIAQALQQSRAHRKFLFLFVSCPVAANEHPQFPSEIEPAALQLEDGDSLAFDDLHSWLGSLCRHECLLVFDTGGSAIAQTAIDASLVSNFSGCIVSGCMGRVPAGTHCSPAHPLRHGIGSEMGLLSFAFIEALLLANTNLTCDEMEQVLCSIQSQYLAPSILSTHPVILPSWILTAHLPQHNQPSPARILHLRPSTLQYHLHPQDAATSHAAHGGLGSLQQTLETQYPPVSPEGSPLLHSPEIEPYLPEPWRQELAAGFSDDDDIMPSAGWRL